MARATQSRTERRKLDARLDEALEETFPASDPFSVGRFTGTEPPSRPVDTKAAEWMQKAAGAGNAHRRRRKPRADQADQAQQQ